VGARFQTTKWSVVIAAGRDDPDESREALSSLCDAYWYPVYGFVRRQGHNEEDARDLTQSYFATLLDKNFLGGLRPEAGRFRSFLLVSIRNFLHNERDRERAAKRGGGQTSLSLDTANAEDRIRLEPAAPDSPEEQFERRWAMTVVQRTLQRLEREFEEGGQTDRFRMLRGYLIGDAPTLPYDRLARELEMTETAVKSIVRRLRKRFGVLLRAEVTQTLDRREDVDDEIRYLLRVLSG
jgi:RNA polymerase sigma-70 factor (ECF subfamily)